MGLQVWLPLNGDLHNQGLNGLTAINNGATVNNNGKIGKCYSFNGSSNYLELDPIFSNGNQILSFSCWMKISALPSSYYCLLSSRTSLYNTGINIYLKSDKTFYIDIGSRWITQVQDIEVNKWYHIAVVSSNEGRILYINGIQKDISTTIHTAPTTANTNSVLIGAQQSSTAGTADGTYFKGYMNDIRIYDHAISAAEVAEIAKGLVLHYKLNNNGYSGNSNLFIGSTYSPTDIANFISAGSTDWTRFLRFYNGSDALHSFADGIDTIKLNSTANIGISFARSAADINLDTSSKYTISCEAQCSSTSKPFCIGLSYYTTSDSWVWRGGTNGQNFTAPNTWQKFTLTFTPDANTKYINYCFTVATGGNNTLKIRNCKLEKGTEATPWMPASSEMDIYDCSGYQNNGTVIGNNLTAAADSPRYGAALYFPGNTAIKVNDNNWCSQGMKALTINLWAKASSWTPKLFSCTETGGFNTEAGTSGYWRFPVHVYTNEAQTSTAYKYDSTEIKEADLSSSDWNMITFVYDTTGTRTYINGELHHTYNNVSYGIHFNTNARLFLGCEANTATPTSPYFVGYQSDFRIYTTALTSEQVADLFHTSASIDASGNIYARELKEV